uniref:Uncharacterized protein n=2 Tax=Rattus norvegicus TaxID=10116 RepID=A0ABK0LCM2_RAT
MRLEALSRPFEKLTPVSKEPESKEPEAKQIPRKEDATVKEIPTVKPLISLKAKVLDKERELMEKYKLEPLRLLEVISEYERAGLATPFTSRLVRKALEAHRPQLKTKLVLQDHPSLAGQPIGQLHLPEILAEEPYSEIGVSDIEWLHGVLKQMEAGEELPRYSFHRLCQLLKDFTKTEELQWVHLAVLEAIVHRHKQTVDSESSKPCREPMSPKHLKVIPPIKGREQDEWLEPSAVPVPESLATKRVTDPKRIHWRLLGEPYRGARLQQLSNALDEMKTQYLDPTTRDILTDARSSVNEQTLALMFQKDFGDLKSKSRYPKLPKLEKKPISKKKEEVPPWETFVALYHVLRMLQQRYATDRAAWMEKFYQLMDLYQIKSPGIQRLLLDLLVTEEPQYQEFVPKETAKAEELVPGERLLYCVVCGSSHTPHVPPGFREVIPLPEKNNVHTLSPKGITKYGILELAWKSLPQADIHLIRKESHITVPTP